MTVQELFEVCRTARNEGQGTMRLVVAVNGVYRDVVGISQQGVGVDHPMVEEEQQVYTAESTQPETVLVLVI